jgi:hypothetical protein
VNFDALAIYRNAFVGAIAAICGWLFSASLLGPFPAADSRIAAAQGAMIGLALAVAIGLTSSDFVWVDQRYWTKHIALHAIAGVLAGVASAWLACGLFPRVGGLILSTFAWVLFCTLIGAASGLIQRSAARSARAALAGLCAGLIGGSTLESLHVWTERSDIQAELATAMSGVYGLGFLGGLWCALDRVVEEVFRTAWLRVETGAGEGRCATLDTRREPLRIGSTRDCHLCLRGDATVAPHHAAVERGDEGYFVEAIDGVTFFGTAGDAPAPVKRGRLVDNSEICVGTQRIRFRENKAEA